MARYKNKLSPVQRDKKLFAEVVKQIEKIGIEEFATAVSVGRTSVFKYRRGEPIEPKNERKILAYLKNATTDQFPDLVHLAKQAVGWEVAH